MMNQLADFENRKSAIENDPMAKWPDGLILFMVLEGQPCYHPQPSLLHGPPTLALRGSGRAGTGKRLFSDALI